MLPPDCFALPLEPDDRFHGVTPAPPPPPAPRQRRAGLAPESPDASPVRLCETPLLLMAQPVYDEALERLTYPPETAAMLLGPRGQDHVVTHFVFDAHGRGTAASITLDHAGMNEALRVYSAAGLDCKGLIHAHPPGIDTLSYGDFEAIRALFARDRNRGLEQFFMPLVCAGRLVPYVVCRRDLEGGGDRARVAQLVLF